MTEFNALEFMDAATTEAFTKRPPLPVGDYIGVIGEIAPKSGDIKKGERIGQKYSALNVPIEIDLSQYPEVSQIVGVPKVTVYQMVMLDLTPDGKNLDNGTGKNNNLRRYREALDMNRPGDPFSPRMMQGRPIRVKIKHDLYEGDLQERVDSVSRI